mgnify:FL=1
MRNCSVLSACTGNGAEIPRTLDLGSSNIQLIVECAVVLDYDGSLTCSKTGERIVGLVELISSIELGPCIECVNCLNGVEGSFGLLIIIIVETCLLYTSDAADEL